MFKLKIYTTIFCCGFFVWIASGQSPDTVQEPVMQSDGISINDINEIHSIKKLVTLLESTTDTFHLQQIDFRAHKIAKENNTTESLQEYLKYFGDGAGVVFKGRYAKSVKGDIAKKNNNKLLTWAIGILIFILFILLILIIRRSREQSDELVKEKIIEKRPLRQEVDKQAKLAIQKQQVELNQKQQELKEQELRLAAEKRVAMAEKQKIEADKKIAAVERQKIEAVQKTAAEQRKQESQRIANEQQELEGKQNAIKEREQKNLAFQNTAKEKWQLVKETSEPESLMKFLDWLDKEAEKDTQQLYDVAREQYESLGQEKMLGLIQHWGKTKNKAELETLYNNYPDAFFSVELKQYLQSFVVQVKYAARPHPNGYFDRFALKDKPSRDTPVELKMRKNKTGSFTLREYAELLTFVEREIELLRKAFDFTNENKPNKKGVKTITAGQLTYEGNKWVITKKGTATFS